MSKQIPKFDGLAATNGCKDTKAVSQQARLSSRCRHIAQQDRRNSLRSIEIFCTVGAVFFVFPDVERDQKRPVSFSQGQW